MGQPVRAIAVFEILSALTVRVSPSPGPGGQGQSAALTRPAAMPTHAIRGTVKSITASTLVITAGKKANEMTFALSPATHREGRVTIGATIAVRYRIEDRMLLATAVSTYPETRFTRALR